jgi:gluconate 2-dehydrogenase gamma chain
MSKYDPPAQAGQLNDAPEPFVAGQGSISRREFMARAGMLASLALAYPAATLGARRQQQTGDETGELPGWLDEPVWQTIAQVQEILFPPGEDIPGASDCGAVIYLHGVIETREGAEDRDFILRGAGWLDDLTQQNYQKNFVQLAPLQQQQTITQIVGSRAGRNWVSLLLTYILEALLADPVYGGNHDGIGWKWLQHQPGYPTPPPDKTWERLQQRRYKA